jgi:DNA-binding protein H-NS
MQFSGEELQNHLTTRAEDLANQIAKYQTHLEGKTSDQIDRSGQLSAFVCSIHSMQRTIKRHHFMASRLDRHGTYFLTTAELQSIEMGPF